jgi:hypothetical protein
MASQLNSGALAMGCDEIKRSVFCQENYQNDGAICPDAMDDRVAAGVAAYHTIRRSVSLA